ncbi:unnamed protein product [Tilletia controversa]|uniref:Uncharacterized protein n=1 Tax=Tilletia caries TaxID=13290 RepID=A0ABN7IVP3_9BASI|nr:unnamed protein product [Tilletia controversa]CAD6931720.1 unnamed protein product [Tilletia caries]CAD6950574.1 unnamed protein product [Tilletia controversa]CAD6978613.1 unnamed protein product [Tilletia controversa]CAD6986310.1 unnamed protein product [Tilletia controversa]
MTSPTSMATNGQQQRSEGRHRSVVASAQALLSAKSIISLAAARSTDTDIEGAHIVIFHNLRAPPTSDHRICASATSTFGPAPSVEVERSLRLA